MKQKITCYCDKTFEVEVPEKIDLDSEAHYLDEILDGSFLNFTCPGCGKKHKPEFLISIAWPSKKINFEVLSELQRGEFYMRKKSAADKKQVETIIGYPELADRIAVIKSGFEPAAIEAIKYYLHLKADEQYPDDEMEIWFYNSNDDSLEFHIHGIREDEVAVMRVPLSLYQKTLDDYKKHPKKDIFGALRYRSYLSVKNMMRPDELK